MSYDYGSMLHRDCSAISDNGTESHNVEGGIPISTPAGGLLKEQKEELNHGEFLPWLESNFEMSQKTAWSYMKAYEHKNKLVNITNLQDAYKQIEQIEYQEKKKQDDGPLQHNRSFVVYD